jgi:hypothetical protein
LSLPGFEPRPSRSYPIAIQAELSRLLYGSIHSILGDDVGFLYRVNIVIFSDVSKLHGASIFRFEIGQMNVHVYMDILPANVGARVMADGRSVEGELQFSRTLK